MMQRLTIATPVVTTVATTIATTVAAGGLCLLLLACASSRSATSISEKTVATGGDRASGGAGAADSSGVASPASGAAAANQQTRGSSMNARVAMGVQTSSPISDHAQVVIDDGAGGTYVGHVVQRSGRTTLNTRPGDRRLVMEGGEGAYLSHYDASYQRVIRVILEQIHFVDAIARNPTTGDLFIAGQQHFYPKAIKRAKLRVLHYGADGLERTTRLDKKLLARLPRRVLEHRVEDMVIDAQGNLYLGITLVRRRKRKEKGGRQDVGEMVLAKMTAAGKIRWYEKLSTQYNQGGGYYAGSSEIAALALSPDGQLIVIGHSGNHIDKDNPNRGSLDVFVQAIAPDSGRKLWTRTFGTAERDVARDLAIAADGTLIVVGNTAGQLFAQPRGEDDAVIMALDKQGEPRWSEQLGTGKTDRFHSVTISGKGAILVAGETAGQLALDRPETDGKSSAIDVLVAGYTPDGVRAWMFQAGTATNDYPAGIAASSEGGAHLLFDTQGSFQGMGTPRSVGQAGGGSQLPHKDMVLLRLRD